jgi:hypothetical protein
MVAVLSFALGMIVTILFAMARSSAKPDLDSDLFEEEEGEGGGEASRNVGAGEQPKEAPRESWEQDPDWWKK